MLERIEVSDGRTPGYQMFQAHHKALYQKAADVIRDRFPGFQAKTILDAGCGCGFGYRPLNQVGHYVGCDRDGRVIEALHSERSSPGEYRRRFFHKDMEEPGFASCWLEFIVPEIIVCLEVAEHLKDPGLFLCTLRRRFLKLLIFSVPTCFTMDFDPYHKRDWSVWEWGIQLGQAGFNVESTAQFEFWMPIFQFLKTTPTTWKQKGQVAKFILTHREYLKDRFYNWVLRRRFRWQSTLFVCTPR